MSNSKLICHTKLSPCCTRPRTKKIDSIAIHCMAGDMTIESCGNWFAQSSTGASSNYGIGSDGRIAMYVEEKDRSWCTSSGAIDNRAITIEVASQSKHPYAVTDAAYKSLINLLVDICERNGIPELRWQGDKSLMGQPDKQNMYVHRWVANKACPGDYLYNLHPDICKQVNARLKKEDEIDMTVTELNALLDEKFKIMENKLTPVTYRIFTDVPEWAKPSVQKAMTAGFINGTGKDSDGNIVLDLSNDFTRTIVLMDRTGMFDIEEGVLVKED